MMKNRPISQRCFYIAKKHFIIEDFQRVQKPHRITLLTNVWDEDCCEALYCVKIPIGKSVRLKGSVDYITFENEVYSLVEGQHRFLAGCNVGKTVFLTILTNQYCNYERRAKICDEINKNRMNHSFIDQFIRHVQMKEPCEISYLTAIYEAGYQPAEMAHYEGILILPTYERVFSRGKKSNFKSVTLALNLMNEAGVISIKTPKLGERLSTVVALCNAWHKNIHKQRVVDLLIQLDSTDWITVETARAKLGKAGSGGKDLINARIIAGIYNRRLTKKHKFIPTEIK